MTKTIAFMPRRIGSRRAQFREYYESRHAPLAIPLFPFTRYRRNHLMDDQAEPGFDCVSEFWIESLQEIGKIMAGAIGDTMRADEMKFLDQASIVPSISEVVLTDGDQGGTLLFLKQFDGTREDLVAACRDGTTSLEFLSATNDRPVPFDAMIRVAGSAPLLHGGWMIKLNLKVDLQETDPANLIGAVNRSEI